MVPKPHRSIAATVGYGYAALLTGLLVIISGVLVLTLVVNLLGL